MDKLRLSRIKRAVAGEDVLNERDELLLVQGVTPRISDLLLHAGYRSVRDLNAEEDVDRLAIRTGLGSKRAQQIRDGVLYYTEHDAARVAEGQRAAHARHESARQAERQAEAAERDAKTLANNETLTAESAGGSETEARG